MISISIVSHRQARLVAQLLSDIEQYCRNQVEVILTLNVPEELPVSDHSYSFPVRVISNTAPKGFSSNHNSAFQLTAGDYFCVLNPDIRLDQDPFPKLVGLLQDPAVGVVGPRVLDGNGQLEDSVRPFPTMSCLTRKILGFSQCSRYPEGRIPPRPDWIAGMFMLFRSSVFRELGGFNERFFLYYEDVDLCARLRIHGLQVAYVQDVPVRHLARRDSHRKFRYMLWHLSSMLRYMMSRVGRQVTR